MANSKISIENPKSQKVAFSHGKNFKKFPQILIEKKFSLTGLPAKPSLPGGPRIPIGPGGPWKQKVLKISDI